MQRDSGIKRFTFGRLRLKSCSFFNNLEEVKNLSGKATLEKGK